MEEYLESCCCFDTSQYSGVPDTSPCPGSINVPKAVEKLDALKNEGRMAEAVAFTVKQKDLAQSLGDWRGKLTMLSELVGMYRHTGDRAAAVRDCSEAMDILRDHGMGKTVTGATVLLNCATTMSCFGLEKEAIPVFAHVARVYRSELDPSDYRFAGLFNNMAITYTQIREYENAERCYKIALSVLKNCIHPENDMAVTMCNLADLYYMTDPEDGRVYDCMEKAWTLLNTPDLPRDGYYRYTLSRCVSAFDKFGYFRYSWALKEILEASDEDH